MVLDIPGGLFGQSDVRETAVADTFKGSMHNFGSSKATAEFTTNSTGWVNVTNPATFNVVISQKCLVMVFAQIVCSNNTADRRNEFYLSIDGGFGNKAVTELSTADRMGTVFCMLTKIDVLPGTINIQLKMRVEGVSTGKIVYDAAGDGVKAIIYAFAMI